MLSSVVRQGLRNPKRRKEVKHMDQELLSVGGEPADTGTEVASTEADTGADVQQEGDFQGNY